jgi:methionine synthase I (cobalamin-dependent)
LTVEDARAASLAKPLLYDGSKGVMLQRLGLTGGEASELWNVTHADKVRDVHAQYADAGADVIQTNTFPGNRVTLGKHGLAERFAELNAAGVRLAREAVRGTRWVSASVGPTGELMEPAGDLTFDKAVALYAEHAEVLARAGAHLIHFETFGDLAELRAAIIAARERTGLPVIATATFQSGGRTLSGNSPEACAVVCESVGAAFVGANCSTGPREMVSVVAAMGLAAGGPLVAKPNAGMPEIVDGSVAYRETAEHFGGFAGDFLAAGVRLLGGCCGTTPEFIREMRRRLDAAAVPDPRAAGRASDMLASAFHAVALGPELVLGEINADRGGPDASELTERAAELAEAGATVICIDFGAEAGRWDPSALAADLALYVRQPLVVSAGSEAFLDELLRRYPGRAGVLGKPAWGALAIPPATLASLRRAER